jgi:hypothetical protein
VDIHKDVGLCGSLYVGVFSFWRRHGFPSASPTYELACAFMSVRSGGAIGFLEVNVRIVQSDQPPECRVVLCRAVLCKAGQQQAATSQLRRGLGNENIDYENLMQRAAVVAYVSSATNLHQHARNNSFQNLAHRIDADEVFA